MRAYTALAVVAAATISCSGGDPATSQTGQKSIFIASSGAPYTLSAGVTDDLWPNSGSYEFVPLCGDPGGSTVTGLDQSLINAPDYQVLSIENECADPIVLAQDSGSLTDNRFHFDSGANQILSQGETVWVIRLDSVSGWIQADHRRVGVAFQATPSRSLGTAFQPSTLRATSVHYSVTVETTVSMSGGSAGRVELRVGPTNSLSGSDAVARVDGALTGTAVTGLSLTSVVGGELTYIVPAAGWVELDSVTASGSPTYAIVLQREEGL